MEEEQSAEPNGAREPEMKIRTVRSFGFEPSGSILLRTGTRGRGSQRSKETTGLPERTLADEIAERMEDRSEASEYPESNDTTQGRILNHFTRHTVSSRVVELTETLRDLANQVSRSQEADSTDAVLLIDASGKGEMIAAARMLARIEERCSEFTDMMYAGAELNLFASFDSVVGAGSGAMIAAWVALGRGSLLSILERLREMPSKIVRAKSGGGCCIGSTAQIVKAGMSAFTNNPYVIPVESYESAIQAYDAVHYGNRITRRITRQMFGGRTIDDLRTNFEAVTKGEYGSLVEIIVGADGARKDETKANVKRTFVGNLVASAVSVLDATQQAGVENAVLEKASAAAQALSQVSCKVFGDDDRITIAKVCDKLVNRLDIQRSLVVVSVTASSYEGDMVITTYDSKVVQARGGKKIVALSYSVKLPTRMYESRSRETEVYDEMQQSIDGIFQNIGGPHEPAITSSAMALVEFLSSCNVRAMRHITTPFTDDETEI
jgi:hypothetical protein